MQWDHIYGCDMITRRNPAAVRVTPVFLAFPQLPFPCNGFIRCSCRDVMTKSSYSLLEQAQKRYMSKWNTTDNISHEDGITEGPARTWFIFPRFLFPNALHRVFIGSLSPSIASDVIVNDVRSTRDGPKLSAASSRVAWNRHRTKNNGWLMRCGLVPLQKPTITAACCSSARETQVIGWRHQNGARILKSWVKLSWVALRTRV